MSSTFLDIKYTRIKMYVPVRTSIGLTGILSVPVTVDPTFAVMTFDSAEISLAFLNFTSIARSNGDKFELCGVTVVPIMNLPLTVSTKVEVS